MQQTGLEWLFRLTNEPRRLWKRYASDLVGFGYFFLWQWWMMRSSQAPSPILPSSELIYMQDTAILNVRGRLDASNQVDFAQTATANLNQNPYLIVNLAEAEFLDSSAIGTLVALTNQARDAGGNLWLSSVPAKIERILALLRLEQFFEACEDVESALRIRHLAADGRVVL